MIDRVLMRVEVMKNDIISKLNERFRLKVQLEEQLKDSEVQLHYFRGAIDTLEAVRKICADMDTATKIDDDNGNKSITEFPNLTKEEIDKLAKTKPQTTM